MKNNNKRSQDDATQEDATHETSSKTTTQRNATPLSGRIFRSTGTNQKQEDAKSKKSTASLANNQERKNAQRGKTRRKKPRHWLATRNESSRGRTANSAEQRHERRRTGKQNDSDDPAVSRRNSSTPATPRRRDSNRTLLINQIETTNRSLSSIIYYSIGQPKWNSEMDITYKKERRRR